ncbi:MAG: M48 family metallopeptidase [Thiohalomonadaceae bacterium]
MIQGNFFDGHTSRRTPAQLRVSGNSISVYGEDGEQLRPATPLHEVEVSSRIGDTPRLLRFADGAQFETADNAGVDALLVQGHGGLLHRLESRLRYVIVGLVAVVACAWALVQYGIPAFAERAAFALPVETSRYLDREVLAFLDRHLLEPTTLTEQEQARLRAHFAAVADDVDPPARVHVEFRRGADTLGPNAIALPSGTIVFTDELVRLAAHEDELIAVLAHEIGHVVRRHGLRQVIQSSLLTAAMVMISGDVSSVSSLVTALPVTLTELGYSRGFEREADAYAVTTLQARGLSVDHFTAVLARLDRVLRCEGSPGDCGEEKDPRWTSYLSTHPATADRLRWIREIAMHPPLR